MNAHLWPLDPEVVYLNHGAFGATPSAVLAAESAIRDKVNRQPVGMLEHQTPQRTRQMARLLASTLSGDPDGLVFMTNATSACSTVLRGWDFTAGDVVLTTSHAYPAILNQLQYLADRYGILVRVADVPFPLQDPEQIVAAVRQALADGPVMAVLSHVTSQSGVVFPLGSLVDLCRGVGVPVLVDGAHAPGQIPIDLGQIGADWYTGNCHKWLFSPKGCAFLSVSAEWRPTTHPLAISHGYGQGFCAEFDWVGTRDPSAWLATGAALDFVDEIGGLDALMARNHALVNTAADTLCDAWGVSRTVPSDMTGAMAVLPLPFEVQPTLAAAKSVHDALLNRHGIEVPVYPFLGRVWLRISAQYYNELSDYKTLAAALDCDGVR